MKRLTIGRSEAKRLHRKMKKYQIGEATDDVRLCIMCLRAIMNNQVNIKPIGSEILNNMFFCLRMVLILLFNIQQLSVA